MTPALSHLPLAIALSLTIAPTARATPGAFAEADVVVLAQIDGDGGFGWAVSEVADVDGDGVMEALVSAPFNDEGGDKAGAIYLYSGAGGALLFAAKGEPGDNLGYGIADAGDVDDDGVPDLIAGAPGVGGGRALVYSGADGSLLLTLASEADGASFGAAVAAAGDVDGDGHGDLLVGAPSDASAGADAGRVHLFAGIDGATIWIRDGAAGSMLGAGTAPLGDVDDDGVPDLVVGAPGAGGAVHVLSGADGADLYPPLVADPGGAVLGQFFVAGLGDLDGDGIPEVYGGDYGDASGGKGSGKAYVWSGADGERLFTFDDGAPGDGCGCGRRAGDADLDGVPDVAVGCYNATNGDVPNAGYVAIYSGSDGALLRTIHGTTPGEQLGFDVVTLGDVNADGSDDLLVSGAGDNRIYILGGAPAEEGTTTGEPESSSGDGSASATESAGSGDVTDGSSSTSAGSGTTASATSATGDASAGASGSPEDSSGCTCAAQDDPRGGLLALALILPLAAGRRPRRVRRGRSIRRGRGASSAPRRAPACWCRRSPGGRRPSPGRSRRGAPRGDRRRS